MVEATKEKARAKVDLAISAEDFILRASVLKRVTVKVHMVPPTPPQMLGILGGLGTFQGHQPSSGHSGGRAAQHTRGKGNLAVERVVRMGRQAREAVSLGS